ncbi:EPS15 homology (EH) domain and SH3 domain and Protein kinase-like domain and EF-hand domain pair-containing protein [Strongyloides ratti]|uniref:EPS15 homology (EH) domain and SH3 domain and Protein kinase-like domain and EF-hand domain pair-containing protein n=1 Tax=Strongyloides ratti TaxID=34506 RepID=A0A090KUG1_STRRB|nr:EPS15 homology (EH) domain and SH3 domain and Protein kinase-like domain and EF-hand domain pair-containing protein [Strongyloides ratti]CEF59510.1 EPS15 homology (EH) domain and SH3 domain and Protein kinase-like domain and EF-hand domain pair-containing protein [Strongyloides ratti]
MASNFFNEVHDREHAIFFLTAANGGNVISYQDAVQFALRLGLNIMIIEQAALLSDFFNGGSVYDWKRFCTFAYLCRAIKQGYILTTPLDLKWRQVPIPNLETIKLQLHSMGITFGPINKQNVGVYQSSTPTPFDERKSGENWNLSANLKAKYAQRFNQLDSQRKDYLDQNVVTRVLRESNLPNHVLAKVWEFCCGSGPISRGRFIAAVFMAEKLAEGYTLPSRLPEELVSVITGMPITYSPTTIQTMNHCHGGMTFEEKRMDNLKRSEAVLQPRREALLEQEQAQKALLMRKQEEERIRREQEQQELAKQKLIETLKYEVKELDGKKKDLTRLVERLNEENLNIQHDIEKAEFTLQGIEENTKELSSEFQKDVEIFRNMTQAHTEAKANFEKCITEIDKYTKEIHLLAQEIAQNSHEMLQLKSRFASNPELVQLEETKNELSQDIEHLKNEIEALKEVATNEEIFEAKAQHLEKENAQKFSTLNSTLMVAAENYMEKYNELNTKGTAKGMINLDKLYNLAKEGKPIIAFPNMSETFSNNTLNEDNNYSSSTYPNPFAESKNEENIDPFANVEKIDNNFDDPFGGNDKSQDNDDFFKNDPFNCNQTTDDNTFNEPWSEIKESNSFSNNITNDKKNNIDIKEGEDNNKNNNLKNSIDDPFNTLQENDKCLTNGNITKDNSIFNKSFDNFNHIQTPQNQIENPFSNANISSTSDKFIGTNNGMKCYVAIHDFEAPKDDTEALSFNIDDMCITNQPENGEWVYGVIGDKVGYVPTSYFKLVDDFTTDTETIKKIVKIIEDGLKKQNNENPFETNDTSGHVQIYSENENKISIQDNFKEPIYCEARMITGWKYEFNGESCFIKQGEILPVLEQLDVQTKILHNGREILIPKALLSTIDGGSLNKINSNSIKNSISSNSVQNSYVKQGIGETRSLQELQEKIRTDLTFSDTKASRTEEHLARLHSPRSSENKFDVTSKIAIAEYDFEPRSDDELRFKKGEKIIVIDTTDGSWGRGYLVNSADTTPMYFPMNFTNCNMSNLTIINQSLYHGKRHDKSLVSDDSHLKCMKEILSTMKHDEDPNSVLEFKQKTHQLCARFLGGAWKIASLDEIKIDRIKGGMSNMLFLCYLTEFRPKIKAEPDKVLLRVYFNPETESHLVAESVIFTLLSERHLGPMLYGIFSGGRLEEYIPSRPLSTKEIAFSTISNKIAKRLARVHQLDIPIWKEPDYLCDAMERWLTQLLQNSKDNEIILISDNYNSYTPNNLTYHDIWNEVEKLRLLLQNCKSAVVFCHNDLQEGNILLPKASSGNIRQESFSGDDTPCNTNQLRAFNPFDPKLVLIDFEYASYNYRGFDFANHFVEYSINYDVDSYPYYVITEEDLPTQQKMKEFFRSYCIELNRNLYENDLEEEAEKMLKETIPFIAISHLFWGIWGLLQVHVSPVGFGFNEYGRDRIGLYFKNRNLLENLNDN